MSVILPNFYSSIIEDILEQISANTARYYAVGMNPVTNITIPDDSSTDQDAAIMPDWRLLFGKVLSNTSIVPMIRYVNYTGGTAYAAYDNTADLSNSDFYVIRNPSIIGGDYTIYKCISNANGANSTSAPTLVQASTFETADGYKWRYITSVSTDLYTQFATDKYFPVVANSTIVSGARTYAGVDSVLVSNSGSGYRAHHTGQVQSYVNTTVMQIAANAMPVNDYYTGSALYMYSNNIMTGQLRQIVQYVSNQTGNWAYLDAAANTTNILPSITNYMITPYVQFDTDGDDQPVAFCNVNPTTNAITSVTVIDPGSGVFRANAAIVANGGTGAILHAVTPPPGGHGSNPAAELGCQGMGIYFQFANSEANTIPININYNQIGIIKNPKANANNAAGNTYTDSTFSQIAVANVSPGVAYGLSTVLTGATSGAKGLVVFSNTTVLKLVGDLNWANNEVVSNGSVNTTITIVSTPQVYSKGLYPLYVQNITNVTRLANGTEGFKIVISMNGNIISPDVISP